MVCCWFCCARAHFGAARAFVAGKSVVLHLLTSISTSSLSSLQLLEGFMRAFNCCCKQWFTTMPSAYRQQPCEIYADSAAMADKCLNICAQVYISSMLGFSYGFAKFESFCASRKVKRFIFLRLWFALCVCGYCLSMYFTCIFYVCCCCGIS